MKIICLEGNIGSGKSTQLTLLQQLQNVEVIKEPTDTHWKEGLDKLYSNVDKYFICFQLQVQKWFSKLVKTKIHQLEKKGNVKYVIIERSLATGEHVFCKTAVQNGIIDDYQFNVIKNNVDLWYPDKTIYIKTNPEICLQRIKSRDRKCETQITLDYLKRLHENYNIFIEKQITNNTLIEINGNQTIEDVLQEISNILTRAE